MKKRYIVYLILCLGLAYLVYHRIAENKKIGGSSTKGAKGKSSAPLNVDGIVVDLENFSSNIDISGSIEANEAIQLRSETAGLVTGIFFKEGSNVNKGTLLVKINDLEIQAQLKQAITKQNLSASNENRAKQLLAKGAISQEEYDTSLADLQTQKSQIQLLKSQLAKTTIYAPFSGKVGLRSISVGEYINQNTVIANLSNINPVKINFSVPEKYAALIKKESQISFNTDGSNKNFTGKIYAIEPSINQQTRTIAIKAIAANANEELLPGAFAKIKLALANINDAILIPTEAIIPVLNGKTVYVCRDGQAVQIPVETGNRTANKILILSGLSKGDTVLTTGAMALKPKAEVKVKIAKN